jgi:hypothetical protein
LLKIPTWLLPPGFPIKTLYTTPYNIIFQFCRAMSWNLFCNMGYLDTPRTI